jgi:hypothetical protein
MDVLLSVCHRIEIKGEPPPGAPGSDVSTFRPRVSHASPDGTSAPG